MSFGGTYRHQIDEKKRIRIPAKLHDKLGENYLITSGTDGCLFIFQKTFFEEVFVPNLNKLPLSDGKARNLQRYFLGNSFDIEEDKQGRFVIPDELFKYSGIVKNVVTKGVGDRIELWAEEKHDEVMKDIDFDDALNSLEKYNF